jgi:phenylalanyl-tRNA synthetase beta chain
MACSEKELGISDEHEGVIILDDDAPVGTPLVDYMGDAVLDISLTPNIARNANIFGVAREVAALTGKPLRVQLDDWVNVHAAGKPVEGQASIEIQEPELNPRFVLGLVRDIQVGPSPYWIQRRLRLAGMRPINNIVDATNYAMWEVGEPLHAFDYDVLVQRAGGNPPKIITRTARPGEILTTLDEVERRLDDFTVLVCDTGGPLSIAGVMGGLESEVTETTRNVLSGGRGLELHQHPEDRLQPAAASPRPRTASREAFTLPWLSAVCCVASSSCASWQEGVVEQGLVDNYPSSSAWILPPR